MFSNIIAKILAGTVVGYATNYLAIKMLFQEFFKFKIGKKTFSLGGVIVKEREQFQNSISKLVESEVIHHQALKTEVNKDSFVVAISKIFSHFFENELGQSATGQIKLGEIDGLQATIDSIRTRLKTELTLPLQNIYAQILQNQPLNQVLSTPQVAHISKNLSKELINFLGKDINWQSFIKEILENIAEKPLDSFLPNEVLSSLSTNLSGILGDLHNSLKVNYEAILNETLDTAEQELDLKDLFLGLSDILSKQSISSFLTEENIENLPIILKNEAENLFASEVNEDIIATLLKYLLNLLGQENTKILDLLSPDLRISLKDFLKKNVPDLLQSLIPWVKSRRDKLEDVVQTAFEQKATGITQLLASIFIGNIGEFVGIEQRIITEIEKKSEDIEALSEEITVFILGFLEENTIGTLIEKIKINNIIVVLSPILKKNIQSATQNIEFSEVKKWLDKPLNTWFSPENIAQELQKFWKEIKQKYLLDKFLFDEKFTKWTQNQIENNLTNGLQNILKNILNKEKIEIISENIAHSIQKRIQQSEYFFEKILTEQIEKHITTKNLGQILPTETENNQLIPFILQAIDMFLMMQWQKYGKQTIQEMLPLFINEKTSEKAAKSVQSYLDENIETITKGQIETLVQKSLATQGEEELRNLVYKAMGKELEPLSWFGAVLGAITGAGLLIMPDYQAIWLMLLVTGIAYGVTGWGTNWLAIKMLFRPYNPIKIPFLNINLPFTPGVLAKNKSRFAKSMGRFIGQNLLNSEGLTQRFQASKPQFLAKIKEFVSKDDYKILENLLENNQEKMINWLITSIKNNFLNPKIIEMQTKNQIENNKKYPLSNLKTEGIENILNDYLQGEKANQELQAFILSRVNKVIEKNERVGSIFPENWLEKIEPDLRQWLAQELPNLTQFFETEKVWKMLNMTSIHNTLDQTLQKNLADLLNDQQEENLKNQAFDFIFNQLDNPKLKNGLIEFINEYIKNEFGESKALKDISNGRLLGLLETNLPKILQDVIELGITSLQNNKEKIIENVFESIKKESSLATFFAGASIKNTIDELLEKGIPNFLRQEKHELAFILKKRIENLGEKPLNFEVKTLLQTNQLEEKLTKIFENQGFRNKVKQITNLLLEEKVFKIPLNRLLKDETEDILSHLKIILTPSLEEILNHFKTHLNEENNIEKLAKPLAKLATEIAERHLFNAKIEKIVHNISNKQIEEIAKNLTKTVTETDIFEKTKTEFVNLMFARLKKYELGQIVDINILKEDLSKTLITMLENPNTQDFLLKTITQMAAKQMNGMDKLFSNETKEFILNNFSNAFLNSTETHLLEVLQSLDFNGIVIREIEAMHPKELEGLFYGFAEKYFVYLIGYGFIFGILFGWIIDFGILGISKIFK
ncbi:MAG: DUF445 family protein [Bacteroidetes bacterium]|nr:MAG: DUF445 family protein [Bacteroidota bacterium]TAG90191.1 MAG: DUF445 family protein [Bacteroidota bacterium]